MFFKSKDYTSIANELMATEEVQEETSIPKTLSNKRAKVTTRGSHREYSIEDATKLFNNLKVYDHSLTVEVATVALKSAGVSLKHLKQSAQDRLKNLDSETKKLQEEIKIRQMQLKKLETKISEVSDVRNNLESVLMTSSSNEQIKVVDELPKVRLPIAS